MCIKFSLLKTTSSCKTGAQFSTSHSMCGLKIWRKFWYGSFVLLLCLIVLGDYRQDALRLSLLELIQVCELTKILSLVYVSLLEHRKISSFNIGTWKISSSYISGRSAILFGGLAWRVSWKRKSGTSVGPFWTEKIPSSFYMYRLWNLQILGKFNGLLLYRDWTRECFQNVPL